MIDLLIHSDHLIGFSVILEEGGEQLDCVLDVVCSARLSNAVHGQLRRADVDGADTGVGGDDGTDGGAAGRVVLHHELVQS